MKIVFIIGNGFDICLGLKTKYENFYNYYLNKETPEDKPQVKNLKEHLKKDHGEEDGYKYWSDLEIGMGNYTTNFSSVEDLKEAYYDLNDNLKAYIEEVNKKDLPSTIKVNKLIEDLSYPYKYLRTGFRDDVRKFLKKWETSSYETHIISFNYTDTIEKILKTKDGNVKLKDSYFQRSNLLYPMVHIHGTVDSYPLIGVNDKMQIKNEQLRENEEVQECLIKPKLNEMLAHSIDGRAVSLIKNATVICIFGHSLGDSDNMWWELVGVRLKSDSIVIYFVYNPQEDARPQELNNIRRKYKNKLLSKTNLTKEEKDIAFEKIYIALNTDMFKIN